MILNLIILLHTTSGTTNFNSIKISSTYKLKCPHKHSTHGGPTVTIVLHIWHSYASYFPTYLSLLANFCSRQSSSSHFRPTILRSFISSQLTTWFCHYSQKTSMPPTHYNCTARRTATQQFLQWKLQYHIKYVLSSLTKSEGNFLMAK